MGLGWSVIFGCLGVSLRVEESGGLDCGRGCRTRLFYTLIVIITCRGYELQPHVYICKPIQIQLDIG